MENPLPEEKYADYPRPRFKGLQPSAARLQALIDAQFYPPTSMIGSLFYILVDKSSLPLQIAVCGVMSALIGIDLRRCISKLSAGMQRQIPFANQACLSLSVFIFAMTFWFSSPLAIIPLIAFGVVPFLIIKRCAKQELLRLGIKPVYQPSPQQTEAWNDYVQSKNKPDSWSTPPGG